jgi:hypothetical protein
MRHSGLVVTVTDARADIAAQCSKPNSMPPEEGDGGMYLTAGALIAAEGATTGAGGAWLGAGATVRVGAGARPRCCLAAAAGL